METQTCYTNPLTLKNKSLHFSIVRIACGTSIGSGCLLDGGRVLTCAHNLSDASDISLLICDAGGVFNTPIRAKVEKTLPPTKGDLALLRIEGSLPAHARPLILADQDMSQNNPCAVYGFPPTNKANGLIFNQARIDSFDTRSAEGWLQMILADADPVGPGFSGSPILDTRLGLLVGLVLQQNPDTQVLVRGIPAQTIADRLGLPLSEQSPYPELIERIDKRFLLAEKEREGSKMTAQDFYVAEPIAQWWGVMNELVAPKILYAGLPKRILDDFFSSDLPILALLDGSGGMGKTTAARLLLKDLCEELECWWIDEFGGEELDNIITDFLESRVSYGRNTLVVVDDWGKYSDAFRLSVWQFMGRHRKNGTGTNVRFVLTAKPDQHSDLPTDLLASNARIEFDLDKDLKTDNANLLKVALAHLGAHFEGLYETLFKPEDRLIGKPFHLLFILFRADQDPELSQSLSRSLSNAEGKFRQVMQYDFDRLYRDEERKGLAVAMLFFAYVKHTHKCPLTYEAFILLANHYSVGKTSPEQRLAAQIPEEWSILNHYITKSIDEGDKRLAPPVYIQFKKDDYPEPMLKINLTENKSAATFLKEEIGIIVHFLLKNAGDYTASQLAYIFSQKEPLLNEKDQRSIVEGFLSRNFDYFGYTRLFLIPNTLPSVSFEQKWDWIKRFNELSPHNHQFHSLAVKFIKHKKNENWFQYVRELTVVGADSHGIWIPFLKVAPIEIKNLEAKRLLNVKNQHPFVINRCLDLLSSKAKKEAKNLLSIENQDSSVICRCLDLLRNEAKQEAKHLLRIEKQNPDVIARCLDILREEAKERARELLMLENQKPDVVCRCLNILGDEAKEEAGELLKVENQSPFVICRCLDLLRDEAIEDARNLLSLKNQHPDVICRCLNLLQDEAKDQARNLLKVADQYPNIICRCLILLGNEVKKEAKDLLKIENQNPAVVCCCIDLLQDEAKEDSRNLLKIGNQNSAIICRCIDLLQDEAKEDAIDLLRVKNQDPHVVCRCLDLLGKKAKREAKLLLKVENQNPDVIRRCIDLLGYEAKEEARNLLKIKNQAPKVICRCLDLLHYEAKEEAMILLRESKSYEVVCRCLDLLRGEAEEEAKRLLKVENQQPDILCRCLELLRNNPEVRFDAMRLMKVNNQKYRVIGRCLQILKIYVPDWPEAREYCLSILRHWPKESQMLVGNCLDYLPQHPLSISAIQQILKEPKKHITLYSYIMHYGYGQHDFWKIEVRRVIQNWQRENRMIVWSCLVHLQNEPAFVRSCCMQILNRWEREYNNTNKAFLQKKKASDRYIQKALAHPQLRELATATAQAMYAREQAERGFLSRYLREIVFGIVEQGIWPAWEDKAEAEMPE